MQRRRSKNILETFYKFLETFWRHYVGIGAKQRKTVAELFTVDGLDAGASVLGRF